MDFRYARPPPPPPSSDPNHHHQQPPPPGGSWYPNQFQFTPPQPPQPQHWPPQPPRPPPYPTQQPQQYPPHGPRPHFPPHHNPPPQYPQQPPYPPHNQDWMNSSWGNQGWEYSVHKNENDWGAMAKAWAASKVETDGQPQQSQFTDAGRPIAANYYHDQYSQSVDPHYSDVHQQSLPASGYQPSLSESGYQPSFSETSYQQYSSSVVPPHRPPVGHLPEPPSFNSGYVPAGQSLYTSRDGNFAGDSAVAYPRQESSNTSLSAQRQEVPSSYSSVAGKEEAGEQDRMGYQSMHGPFGSASQHHWQPPLPPTDRSALVVQPHHTFGNQQAMPTTDLSDQPLEFTPRYSYDREPHLQPNYTNDSGGPVRDVAPAASLSSIPSWGTPATPGVVFPTVSHVIPPGPQVDPSVAVASSIPAHSAPLFGRMVGPNFNPTSTFHTPTAFPGDTYGSSGVPERPKKNSVPTWLREEIIKNKAVIASSAPDHSKETTDSFEDEGIDRSLSKGEHTDGKSAESTRSTEEEDDDEFEEARTAAINQEIKRVLTEVLLKVTDELFDEIATKVLNEDDLSGEVEHKSASSNHVTSHSTPVVPTPKASAKVLVPVNIKRTVSDDVSGKSSSSLPGDVLGLGSYASDDDEDEGNHNSARTDSKSSTPAAENLSEETHLADNDNSVAYTEKSGKKSMLLKGPARSRLNEDTVKHSDIDSEQMKDRDGTESLHDYSQSRYSSTEEYRSKEESRDSHGEKVRDSSAVFKSKEIIGEKVGNVKKSVNDDSQGKTTKDGLDKKDRSETKRISTSKDSIDVESDKVSTHKWQDEKHPRRTRKDDRNGSVEKLKEHGVNSGGVTKNTDSRKSSINSGDKENKKDTERDRGTHTKEDDRKRERPKDEKDERSRHKNASDSSSYKRRRSSSVDRDRNSKEFSSTHRVTGSSDGSSDDSRRKVHSKRRNSSPSPVRSRRRQLSRSPRSKHSQRRHSPYSSLENSRRRSRSRSRKG